MIITALVIAKHIVIVASLIGLELVAMKVAFSKSSEGQKVEFKI